MGPSFNSWLFYCTKSKSFYQVPSQKVLVYCKLWAVIGTDCYCLLFFFSCENEFDIEIKIVCYRPKLQTTMGSLVSVFSLTSRVKITWSYWNKSACFQPTDVYPYTYWFIWGDDEFQIICNLSLCHVYKFCLCKQSMPSQQEQSFNEWKFYEHL